MDLAIARQEGFTSKRSSDTSGAVSKRKPLVVIGVLTRFGRKNNRDAIRKAWMGSGMNTPSFIIVFVIGVNGFMFFRKLGNGETLKKMEKEKGVVSRFVIGRSADREDNLDRSIDDENRQTNDFIILVSQQNTPYASITFRSRSEADQVEAPGELPKKVKMFFALAADKWDADFYAKVNDDVYVNIDALGATLSSHLDKPRVYIGCMKSGQVFSEPSHKWYEPDWWKFGDKKSAFTLWCYDYLSYAVIKQEVDPISLNCRSLLRTYAHDDVSAGSWFIGLDVKHVDEGKFCCSSWSTGLTLFLPLSI
ncbi:hypothetical protein Goklo_019278 [Gossypium klotzschianum]|uniref:Hexosyltransferase n=1 Tax=Gossypium klotzschianum TaxID=34286 RepID=A0A7J8UN92_9ROSI|nr:hypothetical protein [Gossypium klotzschianum]